MINLAAFFILEYYLSLRVHHKSRNWRNQGAFLPYPTLPSDYHDKQSFPIKGGTEKQNSPVKTPDHPLFEILLTIR